MERRRLSRFLTITVLILALSLLSISSTLLASGTGDTTRCSSITLENAAAVLDVSPDDLQIRSHEIMVSPEDLERRIYKTPPYSCTISSKTNFLKSITYVTYVYSEPGQAGIEYTTMQNNFETITRAEVVPGVGDKAFRVGDPFQRLVATKGDVVIDVLGPKEFSLQKQIISLILNKD